MTETAHIFTPTDDSLEARIKAYQSSVNLLFSAEQSRKMIKKDDREDTLKKSYITKVQAKEFIVFSQQFNMTHYRSTKRSTHSMKHSRKLWLNTFNLF